MTRCLKLILGLMLLSAPLLSKAESLERNRGAKHSSLTRINRDTVASLQKAWQYNTGDFPAISGLTAFEDEPVLVGDNLIVCSVTRKLIALNPATGEERWQFDPNSPPSLINKCRGVSVWHDTEVSVHEPCGTRLFMATSDNRLIALDAGTGEVCNDFGDQGTVPLIADKVLETPGEVMALSRPAVVNDVVVVGSSVMDNQRLSAPSGRVLAFDVRTGAPLWSFDPIPRHPDDPAYSSWTGGKPVHGGANVWSGMTVDETLDLVYLPTTSPSVDFYGGERAGDNRYADSVVALKGRTGEVVWHQQLVHHDVWDYDLPTPGMLIDYPYNGQTVPALVQNTKQGLIFIFNRETGEPLVPMEERPTPQLGAVPEERLSPTQPFPIDMPSVSAQSFTPNDAWGFTPIDEWLCRREAEKYLTGPIYTPPSERGTIYQPAPSGGPNWGGGAFDPASGVMVIASNTIPVIVTLQRRSERQAPVEDASAHADLTKGFTFENAGSAYVATIKPFLSPLGAPCSEPPWAKLSAVDLVNKSIVWEVPLGSIDKMAPIPIPWTLGTPGGGAPLITDGGLAFIGFATDDRFRAMDLRNGEELWSYDLPYSANSVPVTYEYKGEQYIVVAAGGHTMWGAEVGDAVVAFRLSNVVNSGFE